MSNHDEDEGDLGAFLAGFVIGGLVGAAAALIMAPQSGEATRAQIAQKGEELRRVSEQRLQEYREMAGTAVEDARTKVKDTTEQVQERARIVLDEGKAKVSGAVESGRSTVERARHELGNRLQGAGQDIKDAGEEMASDTGKG
jgi:gas vesicle protein